MEITKDKWESYRWVQTSGMYNMFDPNAREMTELTKNEWLYIMKNYSELETKYEGELQNEE
tara:strand:- start:533 stop:715 length:183 start_codon:yes stop_codon:yes gene_type:complete